VKEIHQPLCSELNSRDNIDSIANEIDKHFCFADSRMSGLKSELFHEVVADENGKHGNNKVTIVGIGAVGMAAAFSILAQV
jgi:hypothetical protein